MHFAILYKVLIPGFFLKKNVLKNCLWLKSLFSLQNPTLQHYSGYTVEEMVPLVTRLNTLIQTPLGSTCTVRSKYSHE